MIPNLDKRRSALVPVKGRRMPLEQRLECYEVSDEGCWLYTGTLSRGYAIAKSRAHGSLPLHRINYERFVGPIPDGFVIDHLCHTRSLTCSGGPSCVHRRCLNPEHMEPVTSVENVMRGRGFGVKNAQKTHCPQGHPYAGDNLRPVPYGRQCRICHAAHQRRSNRRRREGMELSA